MPVYIIPKSLVENYLKENGFVILNEYINSYTKITIADKFGYKYSTRWDTFRKNQKKKLEISSTSNPFSKENLFLFIKNNNLNFNILKIEGFRFKDYITVEDKESKFKYKFTIRYFLSKNFTKRTFIDNEYTLYNLKIFIEKNYPNMKLMLKEYKGSHHKIYMRDNLGYKYSVLLDNLMTHKVKQGIVSSGNIYSIENIKRYIRLNKINVKLLSENYIKQQDKLKFLCKKCKTIYECAWNNFSQNKRCIVCHLKLHESKIGTKIKQYCKEKHNGVSEYNIIKNPKTGRWLPFDIFIPKYNIFIEINGIQHYYFIKYWHGKKYTFEDQKYRDNFKEEYAKNNGTFIEIDLRKEKDEEKIIKKIENEIKRILNNV